jgi:hypothetical protein
MPRLLGLGASKIYRQVKGIPINQISRLKEMKLFGNYWKRKYLSEIFETINAAGVLQVPLVIMMMMIMEFQFM